MDLQQLVDSAALSTQSLTATINNLPDTPSRIGEMGLFTEDGVSTTFVLVGIKDYKLSLVPSVPRGAPSQPKALHGSKAKPFMVPHLPQRSTVKADEVQNARAFSLAAPPESGESLQLNSAITAVTQKVTALQAVHKRDNDYTIEYHRMGAIRGQVLDADGSVLIDIYREFGITQKTASLGLNTATTNVRNKVVEIKRLVEKALGGVPHRGIHVFCSPEFFDKLTGHDKVEKAFDRWQEGAALRDDLRRGFSFGGVTFEEVSSAVGEDRYIPEGEAIAFPLGVPDMFITRFAPADYIETVNTVGLPYYSKSEVQPFGKGIDIESQSNVLNLNTRPDVVIKLTF
ncbi:major capsid protein [Luteimonas sp. TWI662]|uniref:major capsid protein n=1 Tax=Luteimonas sp. TWI662 TaxID=3136789 RepID=UPI00320B3BF9